MHLYFIDCCLWPIVVLNHNIPLQQVAAASIQDQLLVADAKLGNAIKDKLSVSCVSNTAVQELMRCIRSQLDGLLAGLPKKEMTAMALGLAHR